MVDLAEIQTAYYMVAATGVLVAAGYYIVNLRETIRNRRITFANTSIQTFLSEEGVLRWLEIANMQWKDFDDFVKKYDSTVNKELAAKRLSFRNTCEALGYQYRSGAIDFDTLYNVGGPYVMSCWLKFKPIIERYRKWEWADEMYSNWEFLAEKMEKVAAERDKGFKAKFEAMMDEEKKVATQ